MLKTTDGMFGSGESITRLVHYLGKLNLDVLVSNIPANEPAERSVRPAQWEESLSSYGLEVEILVPTEFEVRPPRANLANSPEAEQAIWTEVSKQLELPNCTFMRVADLWIGPQGNLSLVGVTLRESHTACLRPDKQGSMVGLIVLFDKPSAELMDEVDYLAKKEDIGIYYISKSSGTLIPIKSIRRKYSCQTSSIKRLQLDL